MPANRRKSKRDATSFHVSVVADEYTPEEAFYLSACARYRAVHGRSFLSACDYLSVLKSLGWVPPPVPTTVLAPPRPALEKD